MWWEIVLAAIFYMPHSYLVVAGASINQRSITYVWAMIIFCTFHGTFCEFVSYSVYRVLIEAQELFDETEPTLTSGQLLSANDSLDSTPGIALHIFALAKGEEIILSVPGPLVSVLYNTAAVWMFFQGHSNIYRALLRCPTCIDPSQPWNLQSMKS